VQSQLIRYWAESISSAPAGAGRLNHPYFLCAANDYLGNLRRVSSYLFSKRRKNDHIGEKALSIPRH
jgi:hypothetical protein